MQWFCKQKKQQKKHKQKIHTTQLFITPNLYIITKYIQLIAIIVLCFKLNLNIIYTTTKYQQNCKYIRLWLHKYNQISTKYQSQINDISNIYVYLILNSNTIVQYNDID